MSETVKVRVAVVLTANGHWQAAGRCCGMTDEAAAHEAGIYWPDLPKRVYYLTAELDPLAAEPAEVSAGVEVGE